MDNKFYVSLFITVLLIFSPVRTIFAQDPGIFGADDGTVPAKLLLASANDSSSADAQADEKDELDDSFLEEFDGEKSMEPAAVSDPLYYFNYSMYVFNDVLYHAVLQPVSSTYKALTPTTMRKGVYNFFHNLMFPVRFVNNLLQGEFRDAGTECQIFLINTTIGVLGFGQVAQNEFDLHTADEDLGQTLGSYSIGNGFYLVLPVLGPSSLRDTVGLVGDYFLDPINYVEPWELSTGLHVYDTINDTSFRLGDYEALKAAALDPYVAIRDAYIQHRNEKIKE